MPPPLLILDVGGVVVRHDNALLHDGIAARCADPAAARPRLADGVHDRVIGTGKLQVVDLHRRLVEEYGFSASYEQFLEIWSSHFSEEPGMVALIAGLAARHRLVWFSNTNAAHWAHVTAHYPVLGQAHHAYLSHELGLTKPDAAAFRRVLELEGVRAADAIFVDDRIENVSAAEALGLTGILFTGATSFSTALARYGIGRDA